MTIQEAIALRVELQNVRNVLAGIRDMRLQIEQFGARVNSTATRGVQAANQMGTSFSNLATKIGGATAAIYSLKKGFDLVMGSIEAYQQKRGFVMAMKFALGEGPGAGISGQVDKFAQDQGLDLQGPRSSALKLAASKEIPANQIVATLRAFSALAAQSGSTNDQIKRAFEQYTQIASQGRLQGDELRQIQENGVQLRALLKDAGLGSRMYDTQNPLTFQEINEVLLKFGQSAKAQELLAMQAQQATSSVQRLQNAFIQKLVVPIGQTLAPIIAGLATALTIVVNALGAIPDPVKGAIAVIAGVGGLIFVLKGLLGGLRLWSTLAEGKLTASTTAAALALDGLAISAGAAALKGGGGGGGLAGDLLNVASRKYRFGPEDYDYLRKPGYLARKGLQETESSAVRGAELLGAEEVGRRGLLKGLFSRLGSRLLQGAQWATRAAQASAPVASAAIIGTEIGLAIIAGIEKISGVKPEEGFFARIQGARPEDNLRKEMALQSDLKTMRAWERRKQIYIEQAQRYGSKMSSLSDEQYEKWTGDRKPIRNSERPVTRADADRIIANVLGMGLAGA